jgi:hypothetical protein
MPILPLFDPFAKRRAGTAQIVTIRLGNSIINTVTLPWLPASVRLRMNSQAGMQSLLHEDLEFIRVTAAEQRPGRRRLEKPSGYEVEAPLGLTVSPPRASIS